eukprot:8223000-Pyramimonas_sp.AAC.1
MPTRAGSKRGTETQPKGRDSKKGRQDPREQGPFAAADGEARADRHQRDRGTDVGDGRHLG